MVIHAAKASTFRVVNEFKLAPPVNKSLAPFSPSFFCFLINVAKSPAMIDYGTVIQRDARDERGRQGANQLLVGSAILNFTRAAALRAAAPTGRRSAASLPGQWLKPDLRPAAIRIFRVFHSVLYWLGF
jgi:hypothetical protein